MFNHPQHDFPNSPLRSFGVGLPSLLEIRPEKPFITIGPDGITLVLSFTDPEPDEVSIVRHGPVRCGLAVASNLSTALLVWRFDGGRPLWLDTPFHVCIDPRQEHWVLPQREPHEHLLIMIVLQDQFGIVRALRAMTMPPKLMNAIDTVLSAQVEACRTGVWTRSRYIPEIQSLCRRWPSPQAAMRDSTRADLGV